MVNRVAVRMALTVSLVAACSTASPASSPTPHFPAPPSPTNPPIASPIPSPAATAAPTVGAPRAAQIVYQGQTGLSLVNADGTQARILFPVDGPPNAAHADWSPDGRRIALQAGNDDDWDIWVVNADGSAPELLIDCVEPCFELDAPAWSADGRSIAYSQIDKVGDEYPAFVRIYDIATASVRTVAEVPSGDWATTPRWSPDGRYLAVTYTHYDNAFQSNERRVFDAIGVVDTQGEPGVSLLEGMPDWSWYPDWHPDRDEIIFTGGSEKWLEHATEPSNLYRVLPNGSGLTQLTDFSDDDDWVAMPAWTPEGDSIVVTIITPAGWLQMGRINPDGSDLRSIGRADVIGAHGRQSVPALP